MPRRDLTQERTAQILDAFEQCVLRYGLEGSSLERVAEEAGVKRSILRHYIGNREALIRAMVERLVEKYRRQLESLAAYLTQGPDKNRVPTLLEWLFSPSSGGVGEESIIFGKLITEAGRYPAMQRLLRQSMEEFIQTVATQLTFAFPHANRKNCWTVAAGVVALYSNDEALAPLRLPAAHQKAAQECARRLVATLTPSP